MKIINEDSWWPIGDYALTNINYGIIADDKTLEEDHIIDNYDRYKAFQDTIATNIFKKVSSDNDDSYEYVLFKNEEDEILKDNIRIDFNKEIIILITSAKIKEIYYSKIYVCYLILLYDERVEKNFYSAGVCDRVDKTNSSILKFDFLNEKPPYAIEEKPMNNNEEY